MMSMRARQLYQHLIFTYRITNTTATWHVFHHRIHVQHIKSMTALCANYTYLLVVKTARHEYTCAILFHVMFFCYKTNTQVCKINEVVAAPALISVKSSVRLDNYYQTLKMKYIKVYCNSHVAFKSKVCFLQQMS